MLKPRVAGLRKAETPAPGLRSIDVQDAPAVATLAHGAGEREDTRHYPVSRIPEFQELKACVRLSQQGKTERPKRRLVR